MNDEYILYLDCGDGFIDIYMSRPIMSRCIKLNVLKYTFYYK